MGLQAGDRIVKIEGKSTKGITTEDAVGKLRGKVGTDVTITIAREGEAELIDYTITRGRIVLQSVPYSGMLKGDIGYIKVTQFSQKTSNDIKEAIRSLQTKGMKKLILDLRFNPGGLLNQAIEVSELFLQKDQLIVSTKGRTQHSEASSNVDGMVGKDVPMIVLINQGSASASEIVAGALQDWDRALVLGKTSFGKGSVQTIFPLTNEGHALKLTTAFYYLPKGRCINKPENDVQSHLTSVFDEELEESPEDSSKQDTAEVYYTENGRKMYGDGGITPDVEVEMDPMSWYIQVLERQTKFFKFAIKERIKVEKQGEKIDLNWKVPQFVLDDFKAFLQTDSTVANLKSNAEQTLNMLDTVLIREQKLTGDTSTTLNNAELSFAVEELRKALQKEKDKQFENNIVAITRALKREFLSAVQGESGRIAYSLEYDQQVKEAIKILQDTKKYQNMLKPAN
jgi:carboxyl-terminal processing protease